MFANKHVLRSKQLAHEFFSQIKLIFRNNSVVFILPCEIGYEQMVRTTLLAKVAFSQPSLLARWEKVSPAVKNIKFTYNGKWAQMLRYFFWSYGWSGRRYGLLFHDQCFEPAAEVKEALRRLNLKEPWLFDERKIRLYHAHSLKSHGERLPKEKWTKWEDETWYLKPYLDEIEEEKKTRANTSGLLPTFRLKGRH